MQRCGSCGVSQCRNRLNIGHCLVAMVFISIISYSGLEISSEQTGFIWERQSKELLVRHQGTQIQMFGGTGRLVFRTFVRLPKGSALCSVLRNVGRAACVAVVHHPLVCYVLASGWWVCFWSTHLGLACTIVSTAAWLATHLLLIFAFHPAMALPRWCDLHVTAVIPATVCASLYGNTSRWYGTCTVIW